MKIEDLVNEPYFKSRQGTSLVDIMYRKDTKYWTAKIPVVSYLSDTEEPHHYPYLQGIGNSPTTALNDLIAQISGKLISVIHYGEIVDKIQFPEIDFVD